MNLFGKVLVVLIFVMSIVFMTFTMLVYSTHRNWKELVEDPNTGLRSRLNCRPDACAGTHERAGRTEESSGV